MATDYTSELPVNLYRAADVRELDRRAIQDHGIPGFDLMCRAGRAAFALLQDRWPTAQRIVVVCGTGNNGGDGFVVAALAHEAGLKARVLLVGDESKIRDDALLARRMAQRQNVPILTFDPALLQGDLIVDGLLGTGLSGAVRAEQAAVIASINQSELPVLALDIPSGLCSDTGTVLGSAIVASATLTFIGLKQGLLTGAAADHVGPLSFAGLQVPDEVYGTVEPSCLRVCEQHIRQWLPPRPRTAHKGHHGHVLVIGGDHGMGGAVAMAAEAAGRAGAGLVTVVTRAEHVAPVLVRIPECMVLADTELAAPLKRATVVVIGPGLGQKDWGQQLLRQALQSSLPLIVDADALNLLAQWHSNGDPLSQRGNWILTPHPGEASRLLNTPTADLQCNRFDSIRRLQTEYAATVVLKGSGSLIAGENGALWLSATGNPGMGSGGMGDVLSGVIGALVAQGLPLIHAAAAASWIHGRAADTSVVKGGERGLLATDLMPAIRHWANLSQH